MARQAPVLKDGTKLDSNNFHFRDEYRRINQAEKYGIALAWGICAETSGNSIVLVKGQGIIAKALGFGSVKEAVHAIEADLNHHSLRDARFRSHIVAVLNFAADHADAWLIATTGADAIFMPAHTGPDSSDKEQQLLFSWLGDAAQHRGGYQKHAIVWPRYQLIRVKHYPAREKVQAR